MCFFFVRPVSFLPMFWMFQVKDMSHCNFILPIGKAQKFEIDGRAKTTFGTSFYYYVVQLLCKVSFTLKKRAK